MSLELLKRAFEKANDCTAWSLQLLRIANSKKNGTRYATRQIELSPAGQVESLITDITNKYIGTNEGKLHHYTSVIDYDGTVDALTIYRLTSGNALIKDELVSLLSAVADPDVESDPLEFKAQAYVLKGVVCMGDEDIPLKLISMQKPVTVLKNKYARHVLGSKSVFKEITDKVLTLRAAIDVVILGDTVYFLTFAGETLFNMERAYKAVCSEKVQLIQESSIVTDIKEFRAIAETGHNPRRFVSFDENRLSKLQDTGNRIKMAKRFKIPLSGNMFDTSDAGAAEKLIKLLCKKGMIDPFEDLPVEVSGAKSWQ